MSTRAEFLYRCRMTCIGGSENGTCECTNPGECEMRPHHLYAHYRNVACERMARWFQNEAAKRDAAGGGSDV
jgi:hypothetical protein